MIFRFSNLNATTLTKTSLKRSIYNISEDCDRHSQKKKKETNEEINIMKRKKKEGKLFTKTNNNSNIKNHTLLLINLWEFGAQAYDLFQRRIKSFLN
jgi:hypothetical protein